MPPPKLSFHPSYGEDLDYLLYEIDMKGFCYAYATLENGTVFPIHFVTLRRATQQIERDFAPCYAERGLIVVANMKLETLHAALLYAWETDCFDSDPCKGSG